MRYYLQCLIRFTLILCCSEPVDNIVLLALSAHICDVCLFLVNNLVDFTFSLGRNCGILIYFIACNERLKQAFLNKSGTVPVTNELITDD